MSTIKRLRIFAGPNGSGKSVLFNKFRENYITGYFVNADEIEKKLATSGFIDLSEAGLKTEAKDLINFKKTIGAKSLLAKTNKENKTIDIKLIDNFLVDKEKETHSYEASFAAAFIRYMLIKTNKSFSFETVMSHPYKLEEIRQANIKGYKTYLYFVCTESPLINVARIDNRVDKGGHSVDRSKIEERYLKSLENLPEAFKITHRSYFFDNSGLKTQLIAEGFNGKEIKIFTEDCPNWFINFFGNIF
ncbi:MAG: hypothetical protein H0V01_07640 [Bacteroidetes bacterium]|nr:hypothetical protein [Bacteroidota bacterium]HET6243115.1 hypothetical protein [Bacteroidia bacterium]